MGILPVVAPSFLLALFSVSCASRKITVPSWINSPPSSSRYKYYVGETHGASTKKEGIHLSAQDAYQQIIGEMFGFKTRIYKTLVENMQSINYKSLIEEKSEEVNLKGLKREKIFFKIDHQGRTSAWTLFRVSKKEIQRELSRLKNISNQIYIEKMFISAIRENNVKRIHQLLKKIELNKKIQGHYPVNLAIKKGSELIVDIFIRKGASLKNKEDDQSSPLHLGVLSRNEHIVKSLIEGGGDINVRNEKGKTPLDLASESLQHNIVKILVDRGAISVGPLYGGHSDLNNKHHAKNKARSPSGILNIENTYIFDCSPDGYFPEFPIPTVSIAKKPPPFIHKIENSIQQGIYSIIDVGPDGRGSYYVVNERKMRVPMKLRGQVISGLPVTCRRRTLMGKNIECSYGGESDVFSNIKTPYNLRLNTEIDGEKFLVDVNIKNNLSGLITYTNENIKDNSFSIPMKCSEHKARKKAGEKE